MLISSNRAGLGCPGAECGPLTSHASSGKRGSRAMTPAKVSQPFRCASPCLGVFVKPSALALP